MLCSHYTVHSLLPSPAAVWSAACMLVCLAVYLSVLCSAYALFVCSAEVDSYIDIMCQTNPF